MRRSVYLFLHNKMATTGSRVAEITKEFASKVTISRPKERITILTQLLECVVESGFPENGIRPLSSLLAQTIDCYHDGASRKSVQNLIQVLGKQHPQATCKHVVVVLKTLANRNKSHQDSRSSGAVAMVALKWTTVLLEILSTQKQCEGQQNQLIYLQAELIYVVLASGKKSIINSAYRKLTTLWKKIPGLVEICVKVLTSGDANVYSVCLLSQLLRYLTSMKQIDRVIDLKKSFIDLYIKAVLTSKVKPNVHVLETCKWLLEHVTHDEFKEMFLPASERALLRSPENSLEAITYLLCGVSLDLSRYASDLGKSVAGQLHSKDDALRDLAGQAAKNLAVQCSDPGAIEDLLKQFFAVLNGSSGKLTMVTQRLGVLTGVGNLSYNTVGSGNSMHNLATTALELFIPYMQVEVHEGTLVHALQMMSLWCKRFHNEVPKKVIKWMKEALALKTSTVLVRQGYIQCMLAAFHGNTLQQAIQVLPVLLQSLEKAISQSSQVPMVTEGAHSVALLLKLHQVELEAESKLDLVWKVLTDHKKHLFTSEKFLLGAPDEGIESLLVIIEHLFLNHFSKLTDAIASSYYHALVIALVHKFWKLRRSAQQVTKKILYSLGGVKCVKALLSEFDKILAHQKVPDPDREETEGAYPWDIRPQVLATALECIILSNGASDNDDENTNIMLASLLTVHHPCIVYAKPMLWSSFLAKFQLQPETFVSDNVDKIFEIIIESVSKESSLEALRTLSSIAPKTTFAKVVSQVNSCLNNPSMLNVTFEEFEIMRTPEGELYNKAALESVAQSEVLNKANMKRESKLYSFEDQLAELEIREEIARKKAAQGIKEERKLSKKEQEVLTINLQKEKVIRDRLKVCDSELVCVSRLMSACVDGNSDGFRQHIPAILGNLLNLMPSPLAAPHAVDIFLMLKKCAFPPSQSFIANTIAFCTLRLYTPSCRLPKEWCEEDLVAMTTRSVNSLHKSTIQQERKIQYDEEDDEEFEEAPLEDTKPLSAPSFAFCFPLLNKVLRAGGVAVNGSLSVMDQAIEIITVHAQLRESLDNDGWRIDELGPELLPRAAMLNLLVHLLGVSAAMHQEAAGKALLEVSKCASGDEGCTLAEQEEIDVLLLALQAPNRGIREAALQGLQALVTVLPTVDTDTYNGLRVVQRVCVAKLDVDEHIKKIAESLWESADLQVHRDLCQLLLEDVIHHEEVIRSAASEALENVLNEFPDQVDGVLKKLFEIYEDKLRTVPPVFDNLGRVVKEAPPDEYTARCGIALALGKISPHYGKDSIPLLFEFFVPGGLGDRNEDVQKHMLKAALAIMEIHGKDNVSVLLPVFQKFLDEAPNSSKYDAIRHSVVILMGSLARHLDKSDDRVKPIVSKLIEALSTPSQQVQEAVANCLPPLIPAIKNDAPALIQSLLALLLESKNYAERKGAAYGLAGIVKGLGILSLKQQKIMSTLEDAIQDKKNPERREGALFAFEMLCNMLGRLFEPYVVHVLPHLLLCFGDGNQYVRQATDDTAKAVMSKLSAHGVKLILPSLLKALEEDSWRTKIGSVELLGAMAFCAPKQLSSCLPSIVPKLMEVLTDSHVKVQKAGAQALKQIGSVIRNPEIQQIVPILLAALSEPSKKTSKCLKALLETKFVHFIDAPSLALIMPVVARSFQDRSTETKKMAAQIIGNMYSLTDQKDLAPYLPSVEPGLKASLLDPVPEVRKVSARALGAMVKGMGEASFNSLMPWLMEKLTSEQNSVDRSGAAQGMSEVIAGLGISKLDKHMPDIIKTASAADIPPHVKDGYMMMFIYLPGTFGDKFLPYIGSIIIPILKALADECEYVRDTALRAGQRIINLYADTAVTVFLPELERGLFDENWRIRLSSIQLLGDLLYKISGVTGKMTTVGSEDDNFGTERSTKAIKRVLGEERRNHVLAGLYMGRSDTAVLVRQSALHVWKVVVHNTARTLKEVLPTLFSLLIGCLASTSYDKRQVAARTLGDLVRKLGDRVLPEIIPILEEGLKSGDADKRQGVCVGLSEIMVSTSKDQVLSYVDNLVPTVKTALFDPLPEVRQAAARTFDHLHSTIGNRALDDILPPLLDQLDNEETGAYALDGLKNVMAVKSRVVLPFLVPKLVQPPVNTKALSILSVVAGESLSRFLTRILPAILSALKQKMGTEEEQQELAYCQAVVLSVVDENGQVVVLTELLQATKHEDSGIRWSAVVLLEVICSKGKMDLTEFIPQLMRDLIKLFKDKDQAVLESSWNALNAVVKTLNPTEQLQHIGNLRQAIRYATDDIKGQDLPGFCLPGKGITPVLPIFREGILNGPQEAKEIAASGLSDVIRFTSVTALKPQVLNITGPLIRILGDRFVWNVKVAVLDTLALLLGKVGMMLKPFLPQLQTTFLRALNDPNRAVRLKAGSALGKLVVIHTRVDPLFTELHNGIKNSENDIAIRVTMLHALRGVITNAGKKAGEPIRKLITETVLELLSSKEDVCCMTAAGCVGALCRVVSDEQVKKILCSHLLDVSSDWILQHGRSVALSIAIKEAPDRILTDEHQPKIIQILTSNATNDRIPICTSGIRGLGFTLQHLVSNGMNVPQGIVTSFTKSLNHSSNDMKMTAAQMISYIANETDHPLDISIIKPLVLVLVSNTKDKNTAVQADSEIALVSLLRLRLGDETYQIVSRALDSIPSGKLEDCMRQLRKVAKQPPPKDEVDNTVLH
ncbi:eIF-2-alpha kinase activator GCN1-like [Anneissia japonica]|uniref:eIF-2-alpha kinase activator GCN1-like n=1 Tax=Anneissia japonica TaxID=1529436 RepID=UPI00142580F0|nr:eIF-2-alpha kinase activator GCN1-like [Anneissia japonica]